MPEESLRWSALVGDWMGSQYDMHGRRSDYRLFLDYNGRFERITSCEPDYERKDAGIWLHDDSQGVLRLESETPNETDLRSSMWQVLSVHTCEDSNCILVLRWVAFAGRNLPVLFYRVHGNGRGYGSAPRQGTASD